MIVLSKAEARELQGSNIDRALDAAAASHQVGPWHFEGGEIVRTHVYNGVVSRELLGGEETFSDLLKALRAVLTLDCADPNIPGPTDGSEQFRLGWLAGLDRAFRDAKPIIEQVRAAIAETEGRS